VKRAIITLTIKNSEILSRIALTFIEPTIPKEAADTNTANFITRNHSSTSFYDGAIKANSIIDKY
jgi:hypothetical protein